MKWIYIKSDDDLPKKDGLYHVEYFVDNFGNGKSWALCKSTQRLFEGKWLSLDVSKIKDLKFLDESTPSHGRTAEEIDISNLTDEFKADYIDACSDNRKLRKMLAEVTGLSRIATVEEYASQFKAMEEHRTQPQEVSKYGLLPTIEQAGVIALKILENVMPELNMQEGAMFIAGFQECIKFLQPLPNTVNEELAVTFILDIQDYLYSYMHNNKIEALRKKHLTDAAKYVYNRIEKSFSHPVKEANTVPQEGREGTGKNQTNY